METQTRCWSCGNWKITATAQCNTCGKSGKDKNDNATKN